MRNLIRGIRAFITHLSAFKESGMILKYVSRKNKRKYTTNDCNPPVNLDQLSRSKIPEEALNFFRRIFV